MASTAPHKKSSPRTGLADLLIGNSRPMVVLRSIITRVAKAESTVLVLGESGSGKELVARALHQLSRRNRHNFVPFNCGAIPPELLESELFGHRKGSFTGAVNDRRGRFELADGGTIFLDEIGDMRSDIQVKLLRVLQERCIDRLGDDEARPVDVRVIAATHRNLDDAIRDGRFRADLFYRLNVFPIIVPSLREREQDILLLFEHFAVLCAGKRPPIRATPDLARKMLAYSWPGNCRELLNFVERLTVLWPGKEISLKMIPRAMLPRSDWVEGDVGAVSDELDEILGLADLDLDAPEEAGQEELLPGEEPLVPSVTGMSITKVSGPTLDTPVSMLMSADGAADPHYVLPTEGIDFRAHIGEVERTLIQLALQRCRGNVSHTAELLRMRRTSLIEKLNKYGLSNS